jgi:hypothetical protein
VRHPGKRVVQGGRSASPVPSRRYLRGVVWSARVFTWGFPLVMFLALSVVFGIRHAWLAMAIFGTLVCLWAVTLVWRVRSGIRTWTMTATASALVTGVRPPRDGLTPGLWMVGYMLTVRATRRWPTRCALTQMISTWPGSISVMWALRY